MTFYDFTIWVAGFYGLYYVSNFLLDSLRHRKQSLACDEGEELTMESFEEPGDLPQLVDSIEESKEVTAFAEKKN